jgi:integrase
MARPQKREREKYLSKDQLRAILEAAVRHTYPQAGALIYAGATMGLRLGEAIWLHRGCFERLADNIVEVRTLKQRGQPVHPVAIGDKPKGFFRKLLASMPAGQHFLFPGRAQGSHISVTHAERVFKDCARAAGLTAAYTFHSLRHYRGVQLWRATKDIEHVRRQLRHKSSTSTSVYIHMDEEETVGVARKIDDDL